MIRKGLFLVCALLIPALLLAAKPSKSKGKNKKKAKTEQTDTVSKKKTSDYEKLFKGKKCQTVKGLVTIHKVDGEKLYFERRCRFSAARCCWDRPFRRPATTTTA